jgi:hypothetical protein
MSKRDARVLFATLVHDGIRTDALSDKARNEIRATFQVILRLAGGRGSHSSQQRAGEK